MNKVCVIGLTISMFDFFLWGGGGWELVGTDLMDLPLT